ncbi:MAG: hypothetical protein ACKV0T_10660, partial [Planctomycetales bacterium]
MDEKSADFAPGSCASPQFRPRTLKASNIEAQLAIERSRVRTPGSGESEGMPQREVGLEMVLSISPISR